MTIIIIINIITIFTIIATIITRLRLRAQRAKYPIHLIQQHATHFIKRVV
jgi:hypothetical protein